MPIRDIYKNDPAEQLNAGRVSIDGLTDRREGHSLWDQEIWVRDPLSMTKQAMVAADKIATLAQELETFVWTEVSIVAIDRFLRNCTQHQLGNADYNPEFRDEQWPSDQTTGCIRGPGGSGKSHLLELLIALWWDPTVNQHGYSAREVSTETPSDIKKALSRLDEMACFSGSGIKFEDEPEFPDDHPDPGEIEAKKVSQANMLARSKHRAERKSARRHVAAGTLPIRKRPEIGVLEIIFQSLGMPGNYAQAKLYLRLRNEGALEQVKTELKKAGKNLLEELQEMYVSPHLSAALREIESFPSELEEIRAALKYHFPPRSDLSGEEVAEVLADAFEAKYNYDFPLTLIAVEISPKDTRSDPLHAFRQICSGENGADTGYAIPFPGGRFHFIFTSESDKPVLYNILHSRIPTHGGQLGEAYGSSTITLHRRPYAFDGVSEYFPQTNLDVALSNETMMEVWQELILAKTEKGEAQLKKIEDGEAFIRCYPLSPDSIKLWKGVFKGMPAWNKSAELSPAMAFRQALISAQQKQINRGMLTGADYIADYGTLLDDLLANGLYVDHCRIAREYMNEEGPGDVWLWGRVLALILLISICEDEKIKADKVTIAALCCDELALVDSVRLTPAMWEETDIVLEELERQQLVVFLNNQYFLTENRLHLPPCRIENEKDLTAWVKKIREKARKALKNGPVIFGLDDRDKP